MKYIEHMDIETRMTIDSSHFNYTACISEVWIKLPTRGHTLTHVTESLHLTLKEY